MSLLTLPIGSGNRRRANLADERGGERDRNGRVRECNPEGRERECDRDSRVRERDRNRRERERKPDEHERERERDCCLSSLIISLCVCE